MRGGADRAVGEAIAAAPVEAAWSTGTVAEAMDPLSAVLLGAELAAVVECELASPVVGDAVALLLLLLLLLVSVLCMLDVIAVSSSPAPAPWAGTCEAPLSQSAVAASVISSAVTALSTGESSVALSGTAGLAAATAAGERADERDSGRSGECCGVTADICCIQSPGLSGRLTDGMGASACPVVVAPPPFRDGWVGSSGADAVDPRLLAASEIASRVEAPLYESWDKVGRSGSDSVAVALALFGASVVGCAGEFGLAAAAEGAVDGFSLLGGGVTASVFAARVVHRMRLHSD